MTRELNEILPLVVNTCITLSKVSKPLLLHL